MTAGIHPVYAIDTVFGEVRYFDVHVWWDCGGNHVQSLPSGNATRSADSNASIQSNCTQVEAIQGEGDPSVIAGMIEAHFAVHEFLSPETFNIDSGDLPNAGDSAIDLIGPHDSAAGAARGNLANGVANHLQGFWISQLHGLTDTAIRLANRFIGSSDYLNPASLVTVTYPDGTSVKLRIVQISTTAFSPTVTVLVEILPETSQLPDGRMVPQTGGQFDGFAYGDDSNVVDALINLANRYGIPVTGAGGGRTMTCIRDEHGITCRIE